MEGRGKSVVVSNALCLNNRNTIYTSVYYVNVGMNPLGTMHVKLRVLDTEFGSDKSAN